MTGSSLIWDADVPATSHPGAQAPLVDIVLPVFNEEADLDGNVLRLHEYLHARFPFTCRITIADNASTDATWAIARDLAATLPHVTALHLDEKGRGRALKAAWSHSDARVRAYMDIDRSTDLAALLPLVAPPVSGHSDLAIGTRFAPASIVRRGRQRELISRGYNRLTHVALGCRFSDAQCGFKAVRADLARRLLPWIEDDGWFFNTEMLVIAERAGLRIHEVPVDWTGDPVMSLGGFNGSDPYPSLAEFQALVRAGRVHYFIAGGTGGGGGNAGSGAMSAITLWVTGRYASQSVGEVTLYDLTSPSAASTK